MKHLAPEHLRTNDKERSDYTMRKVIILCLLWLLAIIPAEAVLKEKDLAATLSVLKSELHEYHDEQLQKMVMFDTLNKIFMSQMLATYKKGDQVALMLYSQKTDYVFDLMYACNEATNLYNDFVTNSIPFEKFVDDANSSIARYNNMAKTLYAMPEFILDSPQERIDRLDCIAYAVEIKRDLTLQRNKIQATQKAYQDVAKYLKKMNDYAIKSYINIRENIFINGDQPYHNLIRNIGRHWITSKRDFAEKYAPNRDSHSEWRGPLIGMLAVFIIFYMVIMAAINIAIIKWLIPKKWQTPEFIKKRTLIILTSTVISFAILLMILSLGVLDHNFFIMASRLLAEYAWLVGAIFLSLVIRLNGDNVMKCARSYVPIIVIGFVIFAFRITFMPNTMVNLVFTPILAICTLWQINVLYRYNKYALISDKIYTWFSLATMIAALIMAWMGYTLMAVQLLIWWIIQLTAIQSITCIYDLLWAYEKKHIPSTSNIQRTWFYDAITRMIVPVLGTFSVIGSIYWAATVFDLTEWCVFLFTFKFLQIPNIIELSIMQLSCVIALWFIFRYLIYLIQNFYIIIKRKKNNNAQVTGTLSMNLIKYVGWFFYIFIVLVTLKVNRSGITLILTGLSTGIGFALKDTLENLFYGISLMAGRVKIGDMIECDGVRGKVTSINYQCTMVETLDGSVMAFLNSQLFNKNFKNITRNHGFELAKISVGVAYGAKINEVRDMIIKRLNTLNCFEKAKGISVLFDNFGESSVDLSITVWIPVATKYSALSTVKEEIYNVLNENGIEIPFPQQDIYVKQMSK